ncbi:MAG: protein translocase subunit SecF [Clostridia bacterium]|nr:protein translocase subunit SecF [Clostridia bacterium]
MMNKVVENRKIYFLISAILILAGVVMYFVNGGFMQDVDFVGGMTMYVEMGKDVDLDEVAQLVQDSTPEIATPIVQKSDGTQIVIKTTPIETEVREAVQTAIIEKYELDETAILSVDNVSPVIGSELRTQAFSAAIIAAVLMMLYISIRFTFKTGVAAVVALLHDVLIMLAVYAAFKIPVNSSFIAAILTIIGYSINNTIVVFDRIRENVKKDKRTPFNETINKSLGQTLGRSISTTITTLIPVIMIYALGVNSIREFAFPIIIGLLAGTYSSLFVAGSVWYMLDNLQKKIKNRKLKKA